MDRLSEYLPLIALVIVAILALRLLAGLLRIALIVGAGVVLFLFVTGQLPALT